jgi:RHS repeat-associated protein
VRFASTPTSPTTDFYDTGIAPYGEHYASSAPGGTVGVFGGTIQDTITGMFDTPGREYDPASGRWLSPDPAGLAAVDLTNPPSFNRYAYVGNNPTTLVDPSGLHPCIGSWPCGNANFGNIGIFLYGAGSFVGATGGLTELDGWRRAGGENGDSPYDDPTIAYLPDTLALFGSLWDGGSAPSNFVRMPLPPNAQSCSTNTGVNFNAPPGFSVSNIAANGQTNGLSGARAAVGQGGYYDFQRFQVGSTTQFFPGYTPVANIAVGAYLQGAGVPQWMGSAISNTYAFFKSSNGATAQQAQFRNLGFSLASGKATYSCQPHP